MEYVADYHFNVRKQRTEYCSYTVQMFCVIKLTPAFVETS